MDEREIIKKIKELRHIKPNKDWVCLTRKVILENIPEQREQRREPARIPWFSFQSPVFLTAMVAMAVLLIIGIFAITDINTPLFQAELTGSEYNALLLSLQELEENLNQTTIGLKKVKTPQSVLEVKEAVNSTVEHGERVVSRAKKIKEPKQEPKQEILSVLSEVENALSEMKETSQEIQKEIASREIEELKQGGLSEIQKEILREAEERYNEGRYAEALEKIIEASQKNY